MKHFISSLSVINANTPPCEGRVSSRKILSLLLILFLSIGNAWAETATITFKNQSSGTSDGSAAYTTSNFVSSGIASSDAAFGTITCSATSKCYSGKTGMGLKAGGSSAAGSFTITFSTPLVNVSKVTLNTAAYRSDKSVDITVKNGSTQLSKITSITNTTLYDIDIADLNIASFNTLTIESTKYCYIKSITITYNPSAGGETPEPEPDPDPTPDPEPEPEPGAGGETLSYTWDLSKKTYSAASNTQVTWSATDVNMVADKGTAGTAPNNYLGGDANNRTSSRFYQNSILTITPEANVTITSVVFTATSDSYATALKNSAWTNATATASSKTVTVTPTNGTSVISAKIGATCGFTGVTVNYTKAASDEPEPVIVKTLKSIAVTGMTTTFEQGDVFKFDGTCTATYSVTKNDVAQADETAEVTPTSVSTPNMNTVGTQTIKVAYETVSTTYDITITENEVTPGTYNVLLDNVLWNVASGQQTASVESMLGKANDITFYTTKGSSQMYANATQTRFYKDQTFTISVPEGYLIKSIIFAEPASDKKWDGSITVNTGTYTDGTKTWTGSAQEVTYTFGAQNRIANAEITYEAAPVEPTKTLTSIEITTPATQTTFWQGETFNHKDLVVTAHYSDAADEVITPTVTGSTATAGTATVNVSYKEQSTSYTITVKAIPNTKETAYAVADAYDIIDKLTTANGVFISGTISQIDSYSDQYKSITYWISADGTTTKQLQVYSGKGLESADFAAVTDLSVGDQVIVCGNLKKYSGTYEFDKNNYLASHTPTTKDPAGLAYATTEYTANVGEAFTTPELTNPHNLVVTYSTSDASKATVDVNTGAVTIVAAGEVTITASTTGDATHDAGSASYNITITDPSLAVAVLPFTFDGKKADIEGTAGMTQEGIDSDYNSAPYLKFNTAGDWAIVQFDSEPGEFSFLLKQNGQNAGTFTVYESANGEDYTPIWSGGDLGGNGQSATIEPTLSATARYVKFEYTTKGASTNYGLGSISIQKADHRAEAGIAWNPATISLTVGDAFTAPTFSNPNSVTVSFESSNTELATVDNAGVISLVSGKTGTATITATYAGNGTYKPTEVKCTISVNPETNKVVILAVYNGQWYALKGDKVDGKTIAALEVTYFDGKLYNVDDEAKALIEWECAVVDGNATFKNGENYLSAVNSADLTLSTNACDWVYEDGIYKIESSDRTFLYRATANGFKNYDKDNAGTADYSALPVVTAPVYKTGPLYTIKATAENGTVIGAGIYEADAEVTLTADPAMDYTFVSWTKGGEVVSTANPFVFEATENLDLVANFAEISQTSNTLTGKFSVGEYKYAEFATGNLQYTNGTWGFAKQQYQYVGEANINVGDLTFTGTIDMFGWSTSETNYGVDPRNENVYYDGAFVDWGTIAELGEGWSTLSADQWKYLLNTRTNAKNLKQIARVGSVVGIMLFPDNWSAPLTVTAQRDSYFDVDIHNYTLEQWAELEEAGALFLPAAGRRAGGYGNTINKDQEEETNPENLNGGHYKHYDNGNIYCYYWTSTINESTKDVSYLHNIQALGGDKYTIGTGAVWGEKGRYGQSVRLAKVTDIPVVIRKELTIDQLGTVCLPYNIPSGQVYGATFYTLVGKMDNKVVFDEVTGELAAGVPYLFQASAEEISCFPGTTTVTDPINSGAMKGTFVNLELDGSDLTNIYYFAKNALWSCVDLTKLSVPANRAYVDMLQVADLTEAAPVGVRRITLGVNGQNTATGVDQVQGDNVPTKMIINGQLFILRGEKMYDAQGKLVK